MGRLAKGSHLSPLGYRFSIFIVQTEPGAHPTSSIGGRAPGSNVAWGSTSHLYRWYSPENIAWGPPSLVYRRHGRPLGINAA
jgi:hypothetical protein